MEQEAQSFRIIKNNLVFIIVFTILLLLYIIYLCYEIYIDSRKKTIPFVSVCPDYWTHSYDKDKGGNLCTTKLKKHYKPFDKNCDKPGCINIDGYEKWGGNDNLSDVLKKKCSWATHNNVSWDSLQSAGVC